MASSIATMATRLASALTRLASSPASASQAASLVHRRGLAASAADHHGPAKVNFRNDPMSPSKWKEEQFVIVSLAGWGLLFSGAYKFFTGDKKNKGENLAEATQ